MVTELVGDVTATATALGQAAGSDNRAMSQNVRYKMKFNSATGKWEQEQIMTPLVKSIYPGIRTKEGKTKDISTGLVVPPDEGFITRPVEPSEPEVTPTPTPTIGLGGYKEVQEQYKQPTTTTTGGVRYEPEQLSRISGTHKDRIKYAVMPGGLNLRSSSQNFSLSQSHGLIDDLVNPKTQEETEKKESKIKLPGMLGTAAKFAGTFIQPRSERLQITKMIESGAIRVRDADGNLLKNEDAIKFLTEDKDGRLKIKKGQELINSGFKVSQVKNISKDYANSPAFMHFEEDLINNFSALDGKKLIKINPVKGSSGTNLFGILPLIGVEEPIGKSGTIGEQVLVVEAGKGHSGGGYTSDGKFVGMNGRIYAFGTADQAMQSANSGHIPLEVLKRMQKPDGTLKDLYLKGDFAIDNYVDENGFYTGNVVDSKTKNIISNGGVEGDIVGNTQKDKEPDYVTKEPERQPTKGQQEARETMRERDPERREASRDRATRQEYQRDVERSGYSRV